ncbi:MAG: hypothetical protein E2O88_06085 [Bacteroidetes bacterium]|nr:MAG: hypothetical protein E2O88_06085 [Bacteroidota bacterium]
METTVRDRVHKIIDQIDDDKFLKQLLYWLDQSQESKEGELWGRLTEEQKKETLESLKESGNPDNLIAQEEMKKRHGKWL